ncbi:MAG: SurA N-terminal domain-containing protein [Rhodospirillales bacterium]|nr:SurA N-terminal domain-containing protein [Rhodospirillales bacterium]
MLSALRKRSGGIVVKSLLILLIISFGAWGIQDWLSPAISGNAVATVGDDEIGTVEVDRRVRQEVARLRQMFGNQFSQEQALKFGIIDGIINEQVNQSLIRQGASALGVTISDKLISDDIRSQSDFKGIAGNFDRERFNQVLTSNGLTEQRYVDIVRSSLTNQQYTDSFQSGARAPKIMVDAIYRHRNEKRVVEIALIKDKTFVDVGEPDTSKIEAFHKTNAKQFTAPEYRKFTFLQLEAIDLVDEIEVSEEDIQDSYEARLDEFVTVEKRHVLQMVLSDEEQAKKAQTELLTGREFAIVAKEVADLDEATLDLGVVTKNDLLPALADPAFALMQGVASTPIKSALGWHLLKVTKIEAGGTKKITEVRDVLKNDIAKERAVDSLYNLSRTLEDELGGGASIEEAASNMNFKIASVVAMDQAGKDLAGKAVTGIPAGRAFIQTTFTTEEGEDSQLTESGPEGFFVVRIDGVTAPALRPINTVRAQVIDAWKAKQRSEKSKQQAAKMAADLNNGKALSDIVGSYSLTSTVSKPFKRNDNGTDSGLSPELVKKVFDLEKTKATEGKAAAGHQVVVLASVTKANPSADKVGVDAVRDALSQSLKDDVTAQLTTALRQEIGVDINRPLLNKMYNGEQ